MNGESGFQLGPWQVRPTLGTLTGPGGTVHLEPKVMSVLAFLADRSGEVVTREQFIERVWHGRVVSDEVLSRCISLLRTELGDNAREPRYIQTLPKIGYRMVMSVQPLEQKAPEAAVVSANALRADTAANPRQAHTTAAGRTGRAAFPASPRLRALLYGLGAVALLILTWGIRHLAGPAEPRDATLPSAIVVLPFANLSRDAGDDYFSDGLTEELIDRLARVPNLHVVARTSAFSFKGSNEDVRAIAARLGVGYVLEGSVRKDGDQVRITAQLVDARRGFQIWSQRFDGELRNLFALQDGIANAIVGQLAPRLAGGLASTQISTAPPTRVMPAWELLLRGRYNLQRRDEAPIRRSIGLFQQALELDPGLVDAYCELARAYALLPYYSYEDPEEMFAQAVATLERGAARDPAVRTAAQDTLAFIHLGRWHWLEAQDGFRRALAARPDDPNLHQWYSQMLASVADVKRSLEEAQLARELDVLSPVVNDRLAVAYLWVNDDEHARLQFEVARELGMGPAANPEAYLVLLLRQGDYRRAREILLGLQKLFARASEWIDPFLAALADPAARPAAIAAVARATEQHAISLKYQFGAWLYLGEADRAMDVAFQLLQEPREFEVEFLFARETAALRRHPRFGELLRQIGLDRYWDQRGWPPMCAREGERIACR